LVAVYKKYLPVNIFRRLKLFFTLFYYLSAAAFCATVGQQGIFMNDMTGTFSLAAQLQSAKLEEAGQPNIVPVGEIGFVFQIAGSSSQILIDLKSIEALARHSDPCIAMTGQVGSQVKMRLGQMWIIANIRSMVLDRRDPTRVVADVDFLGEGNEEFGTGRIQLPPRRYPLPDPRHRDLPGIQRGYGPDLRRQRHAACPDRHGLSHHRTPARALCRRDARQAFRAAGIDRYR
jgi:hypothetical protein